MQWADFSAILFHFINSAVSIQISMKILNVFGTRPEAIKMAPVILELYSNSHFDSRVCITGQHREMLDQVLDLFNIKPDFDLNLMTGAQNLSTLTGRILEGLNGVFEEWRPDLVLVHGDTTTTMASCLAAYYAKIAIGHVEAGLRTGNKYAPWPEEINRKIVGGIADIHFAPTERAKNNLLNEGVPDSRIHVTGNTVIDALLKVRQTIRENRELGKALEERFSFLDRGKKIILVTGHRRENFGKGFKNICNALGKIARRNDVQLVYPVHLNPNVQQPVKEILDHTAGVFLIKPLDYEAFIYLMDICHFVITDSGGIQEEAPALGKPALVMRDCTERPEAIAAGTARLIGTDEEKIFNEVSRILEDEMAYNKMSSAINPYGAGDAAKKIVNILAHYGL